MKCPFIVIPIFPKANVLIINNTDVGYEDFSDWVLSRLWLSVDKCKPRPELRLLDSYDQDAGATSHQRPHDVLRQY